MILLCSPIRSIRGCKNFIQKKFLSPQSEKLIIHLFLPNESSSNAFSLSSKNSKFWAPLTETTEKNSILDSVSSPVLIICVSHNFPLACRNDSFSLSLFLHHTFAETYSRFLMHSTINLFCLNKISTET